MAIVKIVQWDIHKAPEEDKVFAMNDEWDLKYGFVAASISQWIFSNLAIAIDSKELSLGDIVSFKGSGNAEDTNYHAAIIHNNADPDKEMRWAGAGYYLLQILNQHFANKKVAITFIGTWLMWIVGDANAKEILQAIDQSEAQATVYVLPKDKDHLWRMEAVIEDTVWKERNRIAFLDSLNAEDETVLVWWVKGGDRQLENN